jgi:dihydrodipicolinate reductase
MMQITNRQSQYLDKTGINPVCTGFSEKQYSRYQALEEKIGARLHSSKVSLDFNMIEKFYSRLLPVTYREWICR